MSDTNYINPFEALAQAQIPKTVQARKRAVETRAKTAQEKLQDERKELTKAYHGIKRLELAAILERHGAPCVDLLRFLKRMTLDDADALLERLKQAAWLRNAPFEDRYRIRHEILRTIDRIKRNAEIDDWEKNLAWVFYDPAYEPRVADHVNDILGGENAVD